LQVATEAFAGTGHAEQDEPQVATLLLDAHALLHTWYPLLQVNPQVVPLHVEVAFGGGTQAVHDAPQEFGLVFEAHDVPQTW
jgi:hypothetical protein